MEFAEGGQGPQTTLDKALSSFDEKARQTQAFEPSDCNRVFYR